ncbi:MAG: hypothetical protein ACRCVW_02455 [Brevinema sp.]
MRFILLLIILLMSGCASNKKQSATQSQIATSGNNQIDNEIPDSNDIFILDSSSHKIITNYPLTSLSTNPIYLDRTNSNYILSYGLTPELYLLEHRDSIEWYGYKIEETWNTPNSNLTDIISNGIYYIPSWNDAPEYDAVYYKNDNNHYFYVQNMTIVSNLPLDITNFPTNFIEPVYLETERMTNETEIIYIADISTNKRLYYKPDNNIYLVKTLYPIIDNHFTYYNYAESPVGKDIMQKVTVYPMINEWDFLQYTNENGAIFNRSRKGVLSSSDPLSLISESNDNDH